MTLVAKLEMLALTLITLNYGRMMLKICVRIGLAVLLLSLSGTGRAWAVCTDQAATGVNWRRCYQDGRDLRGVDLSHAMLREATFQRSDLSQAKLGHADAYRAKLVSSNLTGAKLNDIRLIEADLTRAILQGADLTNADLRNAKLVGADLRRTNLTAARLDGADLRNADFSGAVWTDGVRVCDSDSIGRCR